MSRAQLHLKLELELENKSKRVHHLLKVQAFGYFNNINIIFKAK